MHCSYPHTLTPPLTHATHTATGIHVLELKYHETKGTIDFVSRERFNLYQNTKSESARWAKWVGKRAVGAIVAICITDTAMAKTRPLPEEVYEAMRLLGADDELKVIGYRQPFAFLGVRGAAAGTAVWKLDTKVKSKTMLRIEGKVAPLKGGSAKGGGAKGCSLTITDKKVAETALLDKIEKLPPVKKVQVGSKMVSVAAAALAAAAPAVRRAPKDRARKEGANCETKTAGKKRSRGAADGDGGEEGEESETGDALEGSSSQDGTRRAKRQGTVSYGPRITY
jgi:hypothetical protein